MKMALKVALVLLLWPALAIQAATTVTHIAGGGNDSLFIKSDGSLWGMGRNDYGQLGDGTFNSTNRPVQIVPNNVVAVATGLLHSLFIKSDGSLWGLGDNSFGQLGDGTTNDANTPEEIAPSGVVAVAAGGCYNLFLKSDGSLWGMGDNGSGQLGDAGGNIPEQIVSSNVVAVAGAGFVTTSFQTFSGVVVQSEAHSLFLKSDGSLWGMGDNESGQLGDGTFNATSWPVEIVSNGVVAVATGGRLYFTGSGAGSWEYSYYVAHSLFIKSDGSLWGMGYNGDGELGDGTTDYVNRPEEIVSNNVVTVATGGYHSLFIKSDGSLWGMGDDEESELGNGSDFSLLPVPEKLPPAWLRGTCFFAGTYCLLSSTNAALPVSQWTPVWTNTIVHSGPNNFSAPLPADLLSHDPQRFYILQSQ